MFRFFKLCTLYMNNTDISVSQKSCVCEKLPRGILHVPVNRFNVCDLCGMIRRPPTCSSDEEEKMDIERQKMLLQRRQAEEAVHSNKGVRFKVAVKGKKPPTKSYRRMRSENCTRTEGGGLGEAGDGDGPEEASKMEHEPTAPPPSSPSPAPSGSPCEDMSINYSRRRLIYDDQLVKKFIPLKGPITDPSGGAISKRSGNIWGSPNPHISRPLGPLSQDTLQGCGPSSSKPKGKYTESQLATQFTPFDEYDGPSEDALVEDSARRMLNRPKSLYIEPRPDLPNNRIGNYGFGRIWYAQHTMPSAPAPEIPEPPSGPFINKSPLSEEIKADIKESHKNSNTSSSPIYQLKLNAEEEAEIFEEYSGNSDCEEILLNLGLIELSNENDETIVNEDVVFTNKTMTDEEYSEMLSREWGTTSRDPIIIGGEKISSVFSEKSYPIPLSEDSKDSKKIKLAKLTNLERTTSKKTVCRASGRLYNSKNIRIAPRKPVDAPVTKKQKPAEKLDSFERNQHMCGDLTTPQASYVRQLSGKPALSILALEEVIARNWQGTFRENRRPKTPIPLVANPKELHSTKQTNTKANPVKNKLINGKEHISETKQLPLKCHQCRRLVRNQTENSSSSERSKDSKLDLPKLQSGRKHHMCPVHSDTSKNIIKNRLENLEMKEETTMKRLVFTRKLETIHSVYQMSVDLPKHHLVSYIRQLSEKLSESYVQNQPSMSFLEFRVPDIGICDSEFPYRDQSHEVKDNDNRPETLIPRVAGPSTPETKKRARAVWPSMRPRERVKNEHVFTKVFYAQNFSQIDSLEENRYKHTKATKENSLALIDDSKLERHSQEQNQIRSTSPVRRPETNQDSESEKKMILSIVKYFRSMKKPLKKSRSSRTF